MTELTPVIVTPEQFNAVASKNPIYQAACQVMLQRGLWILNTESSERRW